MEARGSTWHRQLGCLTRSALTESGQNPGRELTGSGQNPGRSLTGSGQNPGRAQTGSEMTSASGNLNWFDRVENGSGITGLTGSVM